MSKIKFDFDLSNACINLDEVKKIVENLVPEIKNIKSSLNLGYETDYASVNLVYDKNLVGEVNALIQEKKNLDISALVVIGIGGSNLGTIAVHRALHGDFYNELGHTPKVYFADTVDSDYLADMLCEIEDELKNGENILINVISKSGTTTETIANFEIFLELIKKYKKNNYQDYIVVTTDYNSKLWDFAKKDNFACLEVPKKVGGRFSVFSAVGLFPLGFLGVDIECLLNGARNMVESCINENFENIESNYAVLSAAIIYYHYQKGANIHDTFVFSKNLRNFGQWYRQLVGESVGKKFNKDREKVEVGITPTVSVGTVDLHSVAQLYLGGPQDKFTTFVTVKPKKEIFLPDEKCFEKFAANIQNKSFSFIMSSIASGVKAAYKKDKRPFVSVHLPVVEEYVLGQLLQWKMLEIIYLGYLLNVNPFDQPQVELYKEETRKMLIKG